MIYLSGFGGFYSYNGQRREAQGWKQTEEGFICFLEILFVFDFRSEIFILNKCSKNNDNIKIYQVFTVSLVLFSALFLH